MKAVSYASALLALVGGSRAFCDVGGSFSDIRDLNGTLSALCEERNYAARTDFLDCENQPMDSIVLGQVPYSTCAYGGSEGDLPGAAPVGAGIKRGDFRAFDVTVSQSGAHTARYTWRVARRVGNCFSHMRRLLVDFDELSRELLDPVFQDGANSADPQESQWASFVFHMPGAQQIYLNGQFVPPLQKKDADISIDLGTVVDSGAVCAVGYGQDRDGDLWVQYEGVIEAVYPGVDAEYKVYYGPGVQVPLDEDERVTPEILRDDVIFLDPHYANALTSIFRPPGDVTITAESPVCDVVSGEVFSVRLEREPLLDQHLDEYVLNEQAGFKSPTVGSPLIFQVPVGADLEQDLYADNANVHRTEQDDVYCRLTYGDYWRLPVAVDGFPDGLVRSVLQSGSLVNRNPVVQGASLTVDAQPVDPMEPARQSCYMHWDLTEVDNTEISFPLCHHSQKFALSMTAESGQVHQNGIYSVELSRDEASGERATFRLQWEDTDGNPVPNVSGDGRHFEIDNVLPETSYYFQLSVLFEAGTGAGPYSAEEAAYVRVYSQVAGFVRELTPSPDAYDFDRFERVPASGLTPIVLTPSATAVEVPIEIYGENYHGSTDQVVTVQICTDQADCVHATVLVHFRPELSHEALLEELARQSAATRQVFWDETDRLLETAEDLVNGAGLIGSRLNSTLDLIVANTSMIVDELDTHKQEALEAICDHFDALEQQLIAANQTYIGRIVPVHDLFRTLVESEGNATRSLIWMKVSELRDALDGVTDGAYWSQQVWDAVQRAEKALSVNADISMELYMDIHDVTNLFNSTVGDVEEVIDEAVELAGRRLMRELDDLQEQLLHRDVAFKALVDQVREITAVNAVKIQRTADEVKDLEKSQFLSFSSSSQPPKSSTKYPTTETRGPLI